MKYKIIFSENAKNDLISIVRYISHELLQPNVAKKIMNIILEAIKSLDNFPNRYRLCDYREFKNKKLRILPVKNYIIFYVFDEINQIIKIYRIMYGKRYVENQIKDKIIF